MHGIILILWIENYQINLRFKLFYTYEITGSLIIDLIYVNGVLI